MLEIFLQRNLLFNSAGNGLIEEIEEDPDK